MTDRRAIASRLLAAVVFLIAAAGVPAIAEDDPLTQNGDGQGTYWQPIVSALYAIPEQGQPTFPEGDGPPVFPPDTIKPPLHFTLNASPADAAPTIDTDWLVYDRRRQAGEHASALVLARQSGKPRLWLHRCREEEYLAGYVLSGRLYLIIDADVVRERFPIPDKPTGAARRELIENSVKVVSGKLQIDSLAKVGRTGAGGEVQGDPLLVQSFSNISLKELADRGRFEFIPRAPTTQSGDVFDGVLRVSLELDLEAGESLGLKVAERRKLQAEIRLAVGDQYIDITKIFWEGAKK